MTLANTNGMISLKLLDKQDWELMMAWRSNPAIYEKGCYTQNKPLEWLEHYTWMLSRGNWWKFFMVWYDDGISESRKVGIVNFGQLDNWNPELNYYIGEISLWGQGVGEKAIKLGLLWLQCHGYCQVHTTVKNDNERSIGVLKSLGFTEQGQARVGETRWNLVLSDKDEATEYTSGRKSFMNELQSAKMWED